MEFLMGILFCLYILYCFNTFRALSREDYNARISSHMKKTEAFTCLNAFITAILYVFLWYRYLLPTANEGKGGALLALCVIVVFIINVVVGIIATKIEERD